MKKLFFAMILAAPAVLSAAIKTQSIEYKDGGTILQGYLAYDDSIKGKMPGVLVVHEWRGLGDYAKGRADQLAKLGYAAFALDMYGKGVFAKDHAEAAQFSGVYLGDRELMRSRALAGLKILKMQPNVDTARLAAIGYCFGGAAVLELARAGTDLEGAAVFHGNLTAGAKMADAKTLKAKILVMQGADDKFTSGAIPAFSDEMRNAHADWQLIQYGNAVHSFTVREAGSDPSTGMAYNANADIRSWAELERFLKEVLP